MWPFTHASCARKYAELEERFEKLRRELHDYELAYEQLYDKARHALSRLSKRLEPTQIAAAGDDNHSSTITPNDRVAQLNRQILERRSRGLSHG